MTATQSATDSSNKIKKKQQIFGHLFANRIHNEAITHKLLFYMLIVSNLPYCNATYVRTYCTYTNVIVLYIVTAEAAAACGLLERRTTKNEHNTMH